MWYQIGLALNVEKNFLDSISNNPKADIINLANVIGEWMNTKSSPVTWETVILAMEGGIVNKQRKADDIRHHLGKLMEE